MELLKLMLIDVVRNLGKKVREKMITLSRNGSFMAGETEIQRAVEPWEMQLERKECKKPNAFSSEVKAVSDV